jgi:hypothetical protein
MEQTRAHWSLGAHPHLGNLPLAECPLEGGVGVRQQALQELQGARCTAGQHVSQSLRRPSSTGLLTITVRNTTGPRTAQGHFCSQLYGIYTEETGDSTSAPHSASVDVGPDLTTTSSMVPNRTQQCTLARFPTGQQSGVPTAWYTKERGIGALTGSSPPCPVKPVNQSCSQPTHDVHH